jgi:hypothetical protein
VGLLVHNTLIEHRMKVYRICVLPSYLFGATSWYLASNKNMTKVDSIYALYTYSFGIPSWYLVTTKELVLVPGLKPITTGVCKPSSFKARPGGSISDWFQYI